MEKNVAGVFTKPLVKDKHMKYIKGLNSNYSEVNVNACTN